MKPAYVLLSCLIFAVGVRARPQQSGDKVQSPQSPTSSDQLKLIADQQQQILSSLNDIKRLLSTSAARPASQPPPPVDVQSDRSRGSANASVAIIEYADFQCPYCGQFEREIYPQISADYVDTGKVKYIFRDSPLEMHPFAMPAARAAHCAGDQNKYWEMHDSLFANQATLADRYLTDRAQTLGLDAAQFAECMSSDKHTEEIQASIAEAHTLGVSGTPTFFIGTLGPNGDVVNIQKKIVGIAPYETFKSVLDSVLASQGKQNVAPN